MVGNRPCPRGHCIARLSSPILIPDLSVQRYSLVSVVNAPKSLFVQLEEMGLVQSLETAEPLHPMLKEMEDYLAAQPRPELARLSPGTP